MIASRRDMTRLIGLGAAVVIIGVPIGLVATTWTPLESSRRGRAIPSGEPEAERGAQQENRDKNQNNRRERQPKESQGNSPGSGASTPGPQ